MPVRLKKHGFDQDIKKEELKYLEHLARICRGDIITMTTIAGSGHPGGSMSSIEIYLTLYSFANITPKTFDDPKRDRIITSHGHTSPGLYACLARLGFLDIENVLVGFRDLRSSYEGHIERHIPGVEWSTGNLGQGLSAGCGFALASKLTRHTYNTFVAMSDAEQAKGQVAEARRFARKYNLNDLTVIIDYNHMQISGRTEDVMPVKIQANYRADGWKVVEIPGHDFAALYEALQTALADTKNPYAIVCETTIGHGVSFMENKAEYHGRALTREEYQKAIAELGIEDNLDTLMKLKKTKKMKRYSRKDMPVPTIRVGKPKIYSETTHPRAVFGNVLKEIANTDASNPLVVFDCDLAESVRTFNFSKLRPHNFFESGVSEHTTATIAGALSINGVISLWADFGVFAIDEVFNQLRLNDINQTNLKIIATHLGYNVGPDGKTHHCIDYIGVLRNLFGFKLIVPCDPNQADRMTRYMLQQTGNWVMGLTRTKLPIVSTEGDKLFFHEQYRFEYGSIDPIRKGSDCAVFTFGPLVHQALAAWARLKQDGITMSIYNVSSPFAIDHEKVVEAAHTKLIISYEDHTVTSGLGSIIGQIMAEHNISARLIKIGITQYGGSDNSEVLYKKYHLDDEALIQTIKSNL